MATTKRGTRSLFALAAASATAIVGIVSAPTPARSVSAAAACDTAFPVADLVADQAVHGLTVSKGTTPDAFTGTVLGVLEDGIAPGLDMVMVRLTNPEIDRVGGIWAGMSGSPVYAEDGRLIGAVAYGLAFGPSPVAGVTPFENMDDYLPTPPPPILKVSPKVAAGIAAETDVTARQAAQGFEQLPMPTGVSGVRAARLTKTRNRPYLDRTMSTMGTTSAAAVGANTIVPGGNLALTASHGDITVGGVGTATSLCGDEVVGFGHPAFFRGKITAGLNPADAIYVQEDPTMYPFKVANIADPVGTITDDHLTGITGIFGDVPATFDVTSTVTYGDRNRTGSSHVSMKDFNPDVTFYEFVANHDVVLDGYGPGSEETEWTINGRKPDGSEFAINVSDRFVSDYDITYAAVWEIPDTVYLLSRMKGVTLDDVTMTSDISDDNSTLTVVSAEYKRGTRWVKLDNRRDVVEAKAGKTLKLRVVVEDALGATGKVPVSLVVPAKAKGSEGELVVAGGSRFYDDWWSAKNVDDLLEVAAGHLRNDQVVAGIETYTRKSSISRQAGSAPQSQVVEGRKRFTIVVS